MRQIATLPDEGAARKLADYLLTLQIETRLDPEPDGWAVWVCDEDRVAQARQELAEFTRNPADPRYQGVARVAGALRQQQERAEKEYTRRLVRFRERMEGLATGGRAVTLALVIVSVAVTLASHFGDSSRRLTQLCTIAPYRPVRLVVDGEVQPGIGWDGLREVREGQLWRLVTPIFLHLSLLHLIFNMLWLLALGGQVEAARGRWRYLLLLLFLAVSSNLAQYYLGGTTFDGLRPDIRPSPLFGGMSGVVYGLFGYVWMKGRFDPGSGLGIDSTSAAIMLGWFVLCLTGLVGPIANVAHAVGLAGGMLVGYVPTLWRRR
jgi:GlpG protein